MSDRTTYYGVLYATALCLIALVMGTVQVSNAQTPTPSRYRAVPAEARQRLVDGYEATFAGDDEAADEAFADVQQLAPEWVEGYRGQAESLKYRSQHDVQEAYLRALEHGADDAAIFLDLAIYTEGQGDTERALEFFRESLDRDRTHYPALLRYGTALYSAGQYSEARDILLEAMENNPVDTGPIQMLAAVFTDDPEADPQERDFYTTLRDAGQAVHERRYQDAANLYERLLIRYQPVIETPAVYRPIEQRTIQNAKPYLPLDQVLFRAGMLGFYYLQDIESGLFFWDEALKYNPNNSWAMIYGARALYARNEHVFDESNAFQLIDSALKLNRRNPLLNAAAVETYLTHYGPMTGLPIQTFDNYTLSKRHRTTTWLLSDTGVTILPFISTGWAYEVTLPSRTSTYRVTVQPVFGTYVDPAVTVLTVLSRGQVVDQVVEDTNGSTSPTFFIPSSLQAKKLHIVVADHAVGALQLSVEIENENGRWVPYVPSTARATVTPEPTATPSPEMPEPTETAVSTAIVTSTASPVNATPTALPLSSGREASRDAIIRAYEVLFGITVYGTGNVTDVVANLDEAVKLAPDWWVPHWAFAEFYTLAETFEWAKMSATRAINLGGDAESRGRLYYLRMNAESRLGDDLDVAAIAEDAQIFIDRQPYSASGYHFLGYTQRKLEQYEDAEATLRHGLSLDPSHQSMTSNLVDVLESQGPNADPRSDYQMLSELSRAFRATDNIAFWFSGAIDAAKAYDGDLAYVYVSQAAHYLITMGMFIDGMAAARAGVEAAPDWALSHMTLGRGFTIDNDYESAVPHFDRAFELDPTLYELHRFRLRTYGYTGKHLSPAETALFFSLTSHHAIPWQLDPSGTTYLPYLDLGAYEMPFEGVEGQTIRIRARAAFNSISNPVLLIVGPDGTPLAAAHNNSGDASRQIAALTFTVPADGSYTLMVGDVHPRTAAQVDFEVAP